MLLTTRSQVRKCRCLLLFFGALNGCAAPMTGSPSLSLVSAAPETQRSYRVTVKEVVNRKRCTHWAGLLFVWSKHISHEALLDEILREYNADVLLGARMESTLQGVPYVYMRSCTVVRGYPAVRKKGGRDA